MTYGMIPDGTNWVDAYGRIWTAHGDDLLLWADPELVLVGDDPQRIAQDSTYVEEGATATAADGTDLTSSIIIDSSALDPATPGSYLVTYNVTDTEGATAEETREVIVLDVNRPDIREKLWQILNDGMPDGLQIYQTPPEQLKPPAVVVGTTEWVPGRMNSLEAVHWTITLKLIVVRALPSYGMFTLETMGLKAAHLLRQAGFTVIGFSSENTDPVSNVDYLTGNLEIEYQGEED